MKNLIILIILGVVGYFAYQYYIGSSQQASTTAEPTSYDSVIFLPEECQSDGKSLEDAIHRHDSNVSINGFTKTFRRCLRKAGFSDSQIDEACDRIKDSR